ncbi:hypothetical protein [Streptomyces sp. NPDC051909]|uniref:hypothetical protein n=1 Tax=Streptomyces sp. NPDC051909 TaxID=3154944 RepID=UPI003443A2D3
MRLAALRRGRVYAGLLAVLAAALTFVVRHSLTATPSRRTAPLLFVVSGAPRRQER